MGRVEFKDNTVRVLGQVEDSIFAFLEESGAEIESQAIDNTPPNLDAMRAQWRHEVRMDQKDVLIGNSAEYAIWQEMGTGEYAVNGDGRKDIPWRYKDSAGEWHVTTGIRPKQMLTNAWNAKIKLISARAKQIFGRIK